MAKPLDVLVLTDCDGSEQQQKVLDSVTSRLAQKDIGWEKAERRVFEPSELDIITRCSQGALKESEFQQLYSKVASQLDIEQLLVYSKDTCPSLYQKLRKGTNIGEALWSAHCESISKNGWDSDFNYHGVIVDEASKKDYPHVIEVLFNHDVIAVDFGTPDKIPHHMIGRGFVAEGAHWPLMTKEGKETGKKAILLPLGLYTEQDQISCAYELVSHEIIGHALLGLKDHSVTDVSPQDCIMSVPKSRKEFVELAGTNRGLVFCRDCHEAYSDSTLYQQKKEKE
ncbi:hypothetical protein HQ545_06160 [Candidatus Woesearchaeota archaeon]|nr:hypothetical protein [Candidatus Woesearchaeota archaeon]